LPNRAVLLIPLGLLAIVFVILVGVGATGTSTGVVHPLISADSDADLLIGEPQPIRSDEWFVQTSWTISQVEQDLPVRNEVFPGGMDATVEHDLPAADWSIAFRPHLLGFLVLPLDQAMAVKWWLPAFAMIGAVFLFAVTLMPRRPVTAAALAVGFFFSPFFQWWYLSVTFYPAAWAFLVMAAVVWCLRSSGRAAPWVLSALVAYVTVALGTGIYVPFIVPVVLVALAFSVGAVLTGSTRTAFGPRIRRLVPVFVAGAAGAVALGIWAITRWQTIVGFTSTVYPGERLQPVGLASGDEIGALLGGFLSFGLESMQGQPFSLNSSEASSFLLPGLFLAVALVWLAVDRRRATGTNDWLSIALLVVLAIMVAYLLVPGWDAIAHALFLDRTTYGRLRIGFGVLNIVMIVVVAVRMAERKAYATKSVGVWVPLACAAMAAGALAVVIALLGQRVDIVDYLARMPFSIAVVLAIAVLSIVMVWFFARGEVAVGAAILLALSIFSSAGVNPVYRGVLDLRETATAQAIERLSAQDGGAWVGINQTFLPTMLLVETGVPSYNGFQSAPSDEMWTDIDPSGDDEAVWNRLANVSWVAGEGDPAPRNPAPDQIQMTFDSCASFAAENVTWVLTESPLEQPCVEPAETIEEGPSTMRIYRVIPQG